MLAIAEDAGGIIVTFVLLSPPEAALSLWGLAVTLRCSNRIVFENTERGVKMFTNDDDVNPYLQQEVMSASPVRLRWMLIRRAEELCQVVSHLWSQEDYQQADQWLLRVREILGELLDGVVDASNPLGKTVSDFYVFLIQLATELGTHRNPDRLETLRELLSIELETWAQVMANQGEMAAKDGLESSPALGLESSPADASPMMPPIEMPDAFSGGEGSFNLEI